LAANDKVFFPEPNTCYSVNGALQLHSNQTVIMSASKTSNNHGVCQHSTTSDTLFASFGSSGARYITIEGFLLFDSVSSTRTSGAAIHIDGGSGSGGGALGIQVNGNYTLGFQDGIWTAQTLNSSITNNEWASTLRDGWHELGISTSTNYIGNYANGPGNDCVYINGLTYSVIAGNACDAPAGLAGYQTDTTGGTSVRGVQFIGNGSERAVQNGYYLQGQSIGIRGGTLTTASSGTGFSAIKIHGGSNVSIGSDIYIAGNWDYCIDQDRSVLSSFIWGTSNSIDFPLPQCSGVTQGYLHDAGGITGGSVTTQLSRLIAVAAATTGALSNTPAYNNSAGLPGGFGATLTATSNGVLAIDGHNAVLNDRILVKNQAAAAQNGIYCVSVQGTASVPYQLSRCLDYSIPATMNSAVPIPVISGTANALTQWLLTSVVTAVGSDAVNYSQMVN
jgi:hypothetical protein